MTADVTTTNRIIVGDALEKLRTLPSSSVDCVITSPPYFLLRNYGHRDQLGLEATVTEWVDHLVSVMDEIARVLKPTGSVWLNLGDSFSRGHRYGAPAKSLLLGPERLLLALADRGWIVRNKVIWAKPNPMPASVADRLTCSWEPLYLLVRSPTYFFDLDVVREPHRSTARRSVVKEGKYEGAHPEWAGPLAGKNDGLLRARREGRAGHPLGKNPGDVWAFSTATYKGAHFAVYPEQLIERPIRLSCPQKVCANCGSPWGRPRQRHRLADLAPTCVHRGPTKPGTVLDPFLGAGTTAVVAARLRRRWIGIELNPTYADLATTRVRSQQLTQQHKRRQREAEPHEATHNQRVEPRPPLHLEVGVLQHHGAKSQREPAGPHRAARDHRVTEHRHDRAEGVGDVLRLLDRREQHAGHSRQHDRSPTRGDALQPRAQITELQRDPPGLQLNRRDLLERTQSRSRRSNQENQRHRANSKPAKGHNPPSHPLSLAKATDTPEQPTTTRKRGPHE
jgi:DNA modification methylase